MYYGIISDIHSNLEALTAVLANLKEVDQIFHAGDMVGYGPDPNACVEKIKDIKIQGVVGNHDKAIAGEMELSWFVRDAQDAILWTQKEIKPENLNYLKSLPLTLEFKDFQMVHGSLREPLEEYIESISTAIPTFERMIKPLCFIGHSHVPFCMVMNTDGSYDGWMLTNGSKVNIGGYQKVIINVGAVGQPRDGDPRVSFGVYDSKKKEFTLHRVNYDIEKVQNKMRTFGLPVPLIERLSFGR